MFQDSFSEGHIYWGRMIAVLGLAVALASVVSHL